MPRAFRGVVRLEPGGLREEWIGPGGSADQENRALLFGAIPLAYNLFTDNTFGTIWGDGTGTTSTVTIIKNWVSRLNH